MHIDHNERGYYVHGILMSVYPLCIVPRWITARLFAAVCDQRAVCMYIWGIRP